MGSNQAEKHLTIEDIEEELKKPGKLNLSGRNLSSINFTFLTIDLSGANLSRANLSGTILDGCTLEDIDLKGANLSDASLQRAMVAHIVKTQKPAKIRATYLLFSCYLFTMDFAHAL